MILFTLYQIIIGKWPTTTFPGLYEILKLLSHICNDVQAAFQSRRKLEQNSSTGPNSSYSEGFIRQ